MVCISNDNLDIIIVDIQNGSKTVELREKGSVGINNASRERGDTIVSSTGQLVHLHCRRSFVNPIVIKGLKRKSTSPAPLATPPTLRSEKQFSFQEDCLFCEHICIERKDEWATEVKGRIEFARDLHAVDALYHSSCSTNFRTGKNVPQLFSPKSDKSQIKRGRPNTNDQHFLKVLDFLEDNDDEQLTIKDLVDRMKALCGDEAYSQPYMKQKVQEHYGSSILITELNGKPNVVTFRQTASTIIHNFYKESQLKKSDEDSKLFLLKTAAALIKSEIRSMPVDKNYYPSNNDILSHEKHIPESLAVFLNILFSEKDASLKISSIGQAIMQATRPRLLSNITGPKTHRSDDKIPSDPQRKQIIDMSRYSNLHKLLTVTGYVLKFVKNCQEKRPYRLRSSQGDRKLKTILTKEEISLAMNLWIKDTQQDRFVKELEHISLNKVKSLPHVQQLRLYLDENGIIRCKGRIQNSFRRNMQSKVGNLHTGVGIEKAPIHIPRLDVTTEEILACGQINMYHYNADKHKGFTSLKFPELQSLKGRVFNNSWQIDALRHVTRQLKSPIPEWSGTMQMFQKGSSTGVSDVTFLPMIDLNPSDMSCIYSTLMFVSKEASRQGRTPVITFDQPLYWKSVMITSGEECSNIIVRLGGFHTQMSFWAV
ncbi:unnamed protein product [Mytilus edulis]|uniref:Uncharacterized protein n=1 Tax=Mytilus edulis TaxID=6550 RepID=A0A8S3T1Z0_MYTED|nr:unnamed protein product [Mytilus edulis]